MCPQRSHERFCVGYWVLGLDKRLRRRGTVLITVLQSGHVQLYV